MVVLALPDLSEIKLKRRQLGLSQAELAQKAGVSQSLIAKIEAQKLVPAYDKAKRVFDFFEQIHQNVVLRAKDMMSKQVKCVQTNAKISSVIKLIKGNAISQLPVMQEEKVVGAVSESIIVKKMQSVKDLEEFREMEVSAIMEDVLPIVTEMAPFEVVSALLDHHPAVLVQSHGKITGIISKSDLLSSILKGPIR